MAEKTKGVLERIGEIAFIICVILAIMAGIVWPANGGITLVLVILGLIVGFINISETETTPYLVAAIALIVAGTAGFGVMDTIIRGLGTAIDNILNYIGAFVAPAAVIVALKAVWSMARGK